MKGPGITEASRRLRQFLWIEKDRLNTLAGWFLRIQKYEHKYKLAYLTRGLEEYFMPRKSKRVRTYEQNGDHRSQLFADQDWSDEINHVRYGTRWTDHLLKEDHRSVDDVLDEVREHLSEVRETPVEEMDAPF